MARARERTVFVCNACGDESVRWEGRCPGCGEWNSLVEARRNARGPAPGPWTGNAETVPVELAKVAAAQSLFVAGSIFDTIAMEQYGFREAGAHALENDRLPTRELYELTPVPVSDADHESGTSSFSTGIQWFLKAMALAAHHGDHM